MKVFVTFSQSMATLLQRKATMNTSDSSMVKLKLDLLNERYESLNECVEHLHQRYVTANSAVVALFYFTEFM